MAKEQALPAVETRLYINGKWVEGSEGTKSGNRRNIG